MKTIPSALLTKFGSERKDNVSQACISAIRTGEARTGSSSYSKGWAKKNVITNHVVLQLRALGYDAIGMNDAPRGGANGEHVVITTFRGTNREARIAFVREIRRGFMESAYRRLAASHEFIMAQARKMVRVGEDEKEVYSGCGSYLVGWRRGKITCAIHGSHKMGLSVIGASCPYMVDREAWREAVKSVMMQYADELVYMDGSGTEFFFRNLTDADKVTNATEISWVPSSKGGMHRNITPINLQIIEPDQIKQKDKAYGHSE